MLHDVFHPFCEQVDEDLCTGSSVAVGLRDSSGLNVCLHHVVKDPLIIGIGVPAAVLQLWMAWLTTEHYNLQTQRATTIGEANGRASIFLGALSAGIIAPGFQSGSASSAETTVFQVLVLSSLAVLGATTFLRCIQIAIDDWDFADRIHHLKQLYGQPMPDLAARLPSTMGPEQSMVMLRPALSWLQGLLTVAGSIGTVTSIALGADVGVLARGFHVPLSIAVGLRAVSGLVTAACRARFQLARWHGAERERSRNS